MLFGIIVLVIGIAFLLQNLGLLRGDIWGTFWPVLLIIIGLSIIFKGKYWWSWGDREKRRHEGHKFGDEMKDKFSHHHEHSDEDKKEEENKQG